jgi:hypothetical protein
MCRTAIKSPGLYLLFSLFLSIGSVCAQETQEARQAEESEFGSKFFDQLRTIFGRFQESDLDRVFQQSKPIQCSELVGRNGEWRPVAFFNEDRRLGDWCRETLDEVKNDLTVYTFRGNCSGDQGPVQVTTEFPTAESIEAYNSGRIDEHQVDITVNDPVTASFDRKTKAYKFELPYLFLTGRQGSTNIYSLIAPTRDSSYATDVTNCWECKAVSSTDITYRFLICRTTTAPRGRSAIYGGWERAFGGTAYFILSDGTEAQTSVNLTFGDGSNRTERTPAATPPPASPARPPLIRPGQANKAGTWQMPEANMKLADLARDGLRLRFSPQTWAGRIGTSQLLRDEKMTSLQPHLVQDAADYCVWRPENPDLARELLTEPADSAVLYSLDPPGEMDQSGPSMVISLKTPGGDRIGTLQCYFPSAKSAAEITVARWISVVGSHVMLEIRR